jgi:hypothetical protein
MIFLGTIWTIQCAALLKRSPNHQRLKRSISLAFVWERLSFDILCSAKLIEIVMCHPNAAAQLWNAHFLLTAISKVWTLHAHEW